MIFNKTTDSACYRCDEVTIWNRYILAVVFENRNILVLILVEFAFAVFFLITFLVVPPIKKHKKTQTLLYLMTSLLNWMVNFDGYLLFW